MKLAKLKSLILLFLNIFNISNDFRYLHINHHYQSRICHEEIKNSQNNLVFSSIQSNVSFFPQMRPEKKVTFELTEDEKFIVSLLEKENNQPIGVLKEKSALSGKKWDAAMKALAKHGLTKVVVDGDNKLVVLG